MKTLARIRSQIVAGEFEFSHHAFKRVVERNITDVEIREVAQEAEMIEDYPNDKYGPSCLLLGFSRMGRPLHLQVSYAETELVKIITLYEPDETEWVDYRKRR